MKVLIIKNAAAEGPGIFGEVLRERGITPDVVEHYSGDPLPDPCGYDAVLVLGGPASANDAGAAIREEIALVKAVLDRHIPYLGICLGMQVLVKAAGGRVVPSPYPETGVVDPLGHDYAIRLTDEGAADPLFAGLPSRIRVVQLHGETVEDGDDVTVLAKGSWCPVQAVRAGPCAYGIQGHLEATAEMVATWADGDPALAGPERQVLLRDVHRIAPETEAHARRLCENFLAIAAGR